MRPRHGRFGYFATGLDRGRMGGTAGVTSLEVALTFAVFIMLMFGTIDLTRYFFSLHNLAAVVSAAARLGPGNIAFAPCGGPPSSWSGVPIYGPLLDPDQLSLCVTQPYTALGLQTVTVTATYNFSTLTPWLGQLTGPITETVTYHF